MEPDGSGTFGQFDLHILRELLEASSNASLQGPRQGNGSKGTAASALEESQVVSLLQQLGLNETHSSLLSALTRPRGGHLLDRGGEQADADVEADDRSVASVASRAVSLVRLGLGALASLTENSGIQSSSLEFWVKDLLLLRGIDGDAAVGDLWSEIESALEDVSELGNTLEAPALSRVLFWAPVAQTLSTTERIVRWVQPVQI
ncbi:hypothetical protein ACL00Q_06525 [Curtobacterium flaccumfaciens pv. flaccumfaciens]|uniref:hypothetical protein n=1 Tax=Curtobacterium flaccumfaciens TaxID=2035 RepID=UPI00399F940B